MKKIEINVPFCGFYESYASYIVERNCFIEWEGSLAKDGEPYGDVSEAPEDVQEAFWEYYNDNYKVYETDLIKNYLKIIEDEIKEDLKIDISFDGMELESPREYNYTTDRIFATAPLDKMLDIYNKIDKSILEQVIKDDYTSYDGFMSFYNNSMTSEEWVNPENYDHNQWASVLKAYAREYNVEWDELLAGI